jgi:hypothetical protein
MQEQVLLKWESMEWLLVKEVEPILQCTKSPLVGNHAARVSKIE